MGAACTGQSLPKKVLIIGPKGSGKTTLLYAWCTQTTDTETVPTDSFNVETLYGGKRGQHIIAWDVTDTQRRRQFYYGTEGIVYVLDGSNREGITEASTDMSAVLKERDLTNLPVLLVLCKQDKTEMSLQEVEKQLQITKIVQPEKYARISVSKTHPESYTEAFEMLCALLFT